MNPILFFPQFVLWMWLWMSGYPVPVNQLPQAPAATHVGHKGF